MRKYLSSFLAVLGVFVTHPELSQARSQLFDHHSIENVHGHCLDVNPWWRPDHIDLNKQPVIGIVSQTFDFTPDPEDKRFEGYNSFIMGTYVRFFEGAGARIVPFVRGEPKNETLDKLSKVNGVLFPGGNGDNLELTKFIFDYAVKENDAGRFFPVWGTCMGYENLANFTASDGDPNEQYVMHHVSLPLKFVQDPRRSKMFCPLGLDAFRFQTANHSYNSHQWSIDPKTFEKDQGLKDFWDVTAVSFDYLNNRWFVESIEAKNYPIMGTQFHPEKNSQAWNDKFGFNHSWESQQLTRFFANQFVAMARSNTNTFGNFTETVPYLLDNHLKIQTHYANGDVYVFK